MNAARQVCRPDIEKGGWPPESCISDLVAATFPRFLRCLSACMRVVPDE
jgi:hypothetical protein